MENNTTREGSTKFSEEFWRLPNDDHLGFIEIPSGTFKMGSDKNVDLSADDDELPQHEIYLDKFFIARYPVTINQFLLFIENWEEQQFKPWELLQGSKTNPIALVSWKLIQNYCTWLENAMRKSKNTPPPIAALIEDGWKVSLPSEVEWEKAARGTDGRIYPWGNEFEFERSNMGYAASPVDQYPSGASIYGVMDLSGNLCEWTRSLYVNYPYPTKKELRQQREDMNVEPPATLGGGPNLKRVARGGTFKSKNGATRCASRHWGNPFLPNDMYGFRLALINEG